MDTHPGLVETHPKKIIENLHEVFPYNQYPISAQNYGFYLRSSAPVCCIEVHLRVGNSVHLYIPIELCPFHSREHSDK